MKSMSQPYLACIAGGVPTVPQFCPETHQPLNPPLCTIAQPEASQTQDIVRRLLLSQPKPIILALSKIEYIDRVS